MNKDITSLPTDYQLQRRIGFRLTKLAKTIQSRLEDDILEHGLTRLKWCVLSGVALEGIKAPSDLADHIGVARPAISRLLKTMETEGLLERSLRAEDGRGRQITVTELGKARMRSCWPFMGSNEDHFMAKLTQEQAQSLSDILDTLLEGEDAKLDTL
ncbi:MarR family winged helix-turn-helix transcriptional regulator [Sulfitobacter sp. SK012]|uniref:MarR family winged helix-turn-helix transcriptional regulator n=1 Tax=Sulfitobacter sp. SK012 TaxID=1389005 RepID=UPI0013B400F3|nr:MarR family transcriptional regulator [Sulfitobacter sp. SK012]